MAGTLSERFSKLKASGAASAGKANRGAARTVVQTKARQSKLDQRRGTVTSNNSTGKKSAKKGVAIKKVNVNGKGKKGAAKGAKGGRGNGKGGKGKKPAGDNKPKSSNDLDKDMDTYWFKAGKGKDPNLIALDNDMDNYFKNKAAAAEAPSTA